MEVENVVEQRVAHSKKDPKKQTRLLSFEFDKTFCHAKHPEITHPDFYTAIEIARKQGWDVAIVTHRTFHDSRIELQKSAADIKAQRPNSWKIDLRQAMLSTHSKTCTAMISTPLQVALGDTRIGNQTLKKQIKFEDIVYKFISNNENSEELFHQANLFFEGHKEELNSQLMKIVETYKTFDKSTRDTDLLWNIATTHFSKAGYTANCSTASEKQAREIVYLGRFFSYFQLDNNETKQPQFECLIDSGYEHIVHIDDAYRVTNAYDHHPQVRTVLYPADLLVTPDQEKQITAKISFRAKLKSCGIDIDDYECRQLAIQKLEIAANKKLNGHRDRFLAMIAYIKNLDHKDWEAVVLDGTLAKFDEPKTRGHFAEDDLVRGFRRKPLKVGLLWKTVNAIKNELSQPEQQNEESSTLSHNH